jgi:hypothetical protein
MATVGRYSIRFDQRNAGNTAYSEVFVSGSNLVLTTDTSGNVTGSYIIPSSSYALSASYAPSQLATGSTYPITASNSILAATASSLIINNNYTVANLTASSISASGTIIASSFTGSFSGSINNATSASYAELAPLYLPLAGGTLTGDLILNQYNLSAGAITNLGYGFSTANISTDNNKPISFLPNNLTESVRFWNDGNVTIQNGETFVNDGYRLDVKGSVRISSDTNITGSLIVTNGITASLFGTSSYALTASYVTNLNTTAIVSPDTQTSVTANNNGISASVSGTQILTVVTQSSITAQNGSSSFELNGRLSASNVNVGIPNDSYPWGTIPLTGSYFSTWNSNTNVSDILRFFAGAFSASYPIPTPNTKTFSGVTGTNTNFGSTVTINGRIPSGSTNANILYLQPLGWATIGATIFSGFTFNTGAAYISYASTVGGSTTVSSSLGSSAFGLGPLNNGNLTQVNLSGSFRLTFASSSAGTVNYTNTSASIIISQSATNLTPSIAAPIASNTVPSANIAVIPPVYQDGYFSSFTGSNLTNSISLSNLSSSGVYVFSASIGINSGSSAYRTYTPSTVTYYYTPLTDASFTQTISSPNSSASYVSAVTRSLSGAPYLTSGSSYRYVVTSSGAFNPLYLNGTVSSVTYTNATLGLTTANSASLTTNPTIQTAGVVKSSDYVTTRAVGAYPFESDVIVFDLTLNSIGTGSNAASSGSSFSTFSVSTTTYNRAGSGTVVGSQTYNIHTAGSFGIPSASGSLLYFGRPEGYVTSSLTFGSQSLNPGAITEQLLDEANRIVLADNMLNMSGSSFNSASYLSTSDLQVKPGYLANPGGANGYWYPSGYGTTYKYYVRRFKSNLVVNKLQITLTGNTSLVNWDSTASNSVAMAILFESANTNVYARCRLYDVNNLSNNVISSSVTPSNLNTSGVNPFGSNIDLYGNNGTGASNSSGIFIFPTRAADGAILDNTNAAQDELYLLIRYNGSPTPITSIKIEKLS